LTARLAFSISFDMKIATVQFRPRFGRIEENIERVRALLTGINADLFVLPELCFSGYTFQSIDEVQALSELVLGSFSIEKMRELSAELDAGIIFGFPEKAPEGLYNSCAFVSPDLQIRTYRKLHLFMYEKNWFLPGDGPLEVFEFRGCRVGMMICFDWIFPETARTLALRGAHLICHPANLVMPYCQAAMIIRCLENRVFAATANRIGEEARGEQENRFTGQSQIISPKGIILYRGSCDKDEIGIADINYRESEDKAVNVKNNLWADRRPQFYFGYGEKKL
jgi:predicted amidohydrolase